MSGPERGEGGAVHPEMRDEIAAYAVWALTPEDAATVERHVAGCDDCHAYLEWLRPAVDAIPASVEQLDPPPALRRSLLAAVREDARSQAGLGRRTLGFALRPATIVAAVAILVAGGAAGYLIHKSGESEPQLIAAAPTADAPAGVGSSVLEVDGDQGTLHVEELPPAEPGETYQVWIERGDALIPSSTFAGTPGEDIPLDGTLEGAANVYVTVEPEGGSQAPTSAPILAAPLG